MSGAAEANRVLLQAASTAEAERAFEMLLRIALRLSFGEHDLVETMQDVARLILAADDLSQVAGHLAETARAKLAEQMAETGASNIRLEAHTVVAGAKPARVIITDAEAVPPSLMRQPPPSPDLHAIAKLLRDGQSLPYAVLSNSGEPVLSFRARKP